MNTKRPTVEAAEEILNLYFPVHNAGFIALKDYQGGDDTIEEAARVSYSYGTRKAGEQRALIRSMLRRGHSSPFEQVTFRFHCAMPIFVARQWIRTRMSSTNEMSGRYSLMPMLFHRPERQHVLAQIKTDRQGRAGELPEVTVDRFLDLQRVSQQVDRGNYQWAVEHDIARELARTELPLSTMTQWYWKIDGNNLLKTLSLRCDEHAQWETRQYFDIMAGMVKRVMPIAFEAWLDYRFYGQQFSHQEMKILRSLVAYDRGPDGRRRLFVEDADLSEDELLEQLSKTEVTELLTKFDTPKDRSFDLDLTTAKPPEYFESMYREAAEP